MPAVIFECPIDIADSCSTAWTASKGRSYRITTYISFSSTTTVSQQWSPTPAKATDAPRTVDAIDRGQIAQATPKSAEQLQGLSGPGVRSSKR